MTDEIQVSYSEIKDARRCALKHDLAWREGWRKQHRPTSPLAFGTAWHECMEAYYQGLNRSYDYGHAVPNYSYRGGWHAALDKLQDQPEEIQDQLRWMIEGYAAWYGREDGWRVLATERQLIVPLPQVFQDLKINLKVKIDLIVQDKYGSIWVDDHKCLESNTPIVTTEGYLSIGQIRSGDQVLGSDGGWTKVNKVTHRQLPGYRITLRNRKTIICTDDHRWPVERTVHLGRYRHEELTTKELIDQLQEGCEYRLIHAPATQFPERNFSLHPYALGALLGDGGMTGRTVRFFKNHDATVERLRACLPAEVAMNEYKEDRVRSFGLQGLSPILHDLGLMERHGRDKFIPTEYLTGSLEQRWSLLHGLMDTDGSSRKGVPLYTTASKNLAVDVTKLVESLGGVATLWENDSTGSDSSWEVKMRFDKESRCPFLHEGKKSRWKPANRTLNERLVIENIESLGQINCTDLEVDAEDCLFEVTGVLTHNSVSQIPSQRQQIDPQLPLYMYALEQEGWHPFGARYSYSRKPSKTFKDIPLKDRFRRRLVAHTSREVNTIARDCYISVYSRYRQSEALGWQNYGPRNVTPDCSYTCDFVTPCEASRKGYDINEFLSDQGLSRWRETPKRPEAT